MTIIEQIKAEIEKRIHSIENCPFIEAEFGASEKRDGKLIAYKDLLSFLSTLEESVRPEPYNPVYDEAYLNEKIKKATESWRGVDVDAMLAECRGYDEEKSEKPMQEGLEEEIAGMYRALFGTDIINRKEMIYLDTFEAIARHFAQWGAEWQAKQDQETIELAEDHAYLAGAVNEREKMMKEAVEVRVQTSPLNGPLGISAYCCNFPSKHPFYHCKEGDKVRVIIVKED